MKTPFGLLVGAALALCFPGINRGAPLDLKVGDAIELNLREGLGAHVVNVSASRLGSRLIRGRVDGPSGGSVLLVQHGTATAGGVWVSAEEQYQIDNRGTRKIAAPTTPLCACAADHTLPHPAFHPSITDAPASTTFDVLIVYTPAALAAEGSVDALTAQADLAMADANVCYENSGIPIHGEIVGVRAVDYTETGEIRTDLHSLAVPGDGVLDEVQGYRDAARADFVCMFTRRDSADGYKGYAEILTALTPDSEVLGYSVVDVQAATVEHLFAHELGHNMGCDHDRENTTGLRLFDSSYGWRFRGTDGVLYRDVMAYAPGVSTPYFGNPAVSYQGTPTGVADYADTARTLRASAPAFVNFRSADGLARVSLQATVSEASVDDVGSRRAKFVFERTGGVAQPLDVSYQIGGTAIAGITYNSLPGHIVFAANSHFANLHVQPRPDAPPFGAATVALEVQASDGYLPADSPDGATTAATVTIDDRLPLVNFGKVTPASGKLKVRVLRAGSIEKALAVHYRIGGTERGVVRILAGAMGANLVAPLPAGGGGTIEITLRANPAYNVGSANTVDFSY